MLDSALGLPSLFWTEEFQWFFIPWPFAMWPPFGSRLCSFSIIAKDWQFWLEFHLRFIVICQFSLAEWTLVMFFLCYIFRHPSVGCVPGRMFFPSAFAPLAFFLRVQFPVGSVQPWVAVPCGESICVYSPIAVQFPADSDVYF